MEVNFEIKQYTDKILILPREEVSYRIANKIFEIRFGWLFWDLRLSFNF